MFKTSKLKFFKVKVWLKGKRLKVSENVCVFKVKIDEFLGIERIALLMIDVRSGLPCSLDLSVVMVGENWAPTSLRASLLDDTDTLSGFNAAVSMA